MIIALRTDGDTAEIWLFDAAGTEVGHHTWEAGRQLSSQLLAELKALLVKRQKTWKDLTGVTVFGGPGSFTGLRIGVTIANTIAYAQNIPVAATGGDDWAAQGLAALVAGKGQVQVTPHYGAAPNITKPKR